MIPTTYSPFTPFSAIVKASSDTVAAGAKAYGEALGKIYDSYGMTQQANYARTTLPFYISSASNEAMSWGTFMLLAGRNPLVATGLKSAELFGRGFALGIFPSPLPFG